MVRPVPEVEGVADALRRAEEAWRAVAPAGPEAEAILRHGARLWWLLRDRVDPGVARTVAAASLLHEIGRFVDDRGHYAIRGARWAAIHLDRLLPAPSLAERRLAGELILFQRHRGPLPADLLLPTVIDRFRAAERRDLAGLDGTADPVLAAAEAAAPRGPLAAALRRSDRRERWRHPLVAGRFTRIRRPDR